MKAIIIILSLFIASSSFSQTIDINDYYLDSTQNFLFFEGSVSEASSKFTYDDEYRLISEQISNGEHTTYNYEEHKTTIKFYNADGEISSKEEKVFNQSGQLLIHNFYREYNDEIALYQKDSFVINEQNLPTEYFRYYILNTPVLRAGFTKEYNSKNLLSFEHSTLFSQSSTQLQDLDTYYYYNEMDSLVRIEKFNNLNNSTLVDIIVNRYFTGSQLDSTETINNHSSGINDINVETFTYLEEYILKHAIFKRYFNNSLIVIDSGMYTQSYPSDNILTKYSKIKEFWKDENGGFTLRIQTLNSETLSDDQEDFIYTKILSAGTLANSTQSYLYKRKNIKELEQDSTNLILTTSLFPNPIINGEIFSIKSPIEYEQILLYNSIGQFISNKKMDQEGTYIAPQNSGVYFLVLVNQKNEVISDILKLVVI